MLWLWYRPAATVPIRPLAWEPPYVTGVAQERQKDKKQNKTKLRTFIKIDYLLGLKISINRFGFDLKEPTTGLKYRTHTYIHTHTD